MARRHGRLASILLLSLSLAAGAVQMLAPVLAQTVPAEQAPSVNPSLPASESAAPAPQAPVPTPAPTPSTAAAPAAKPVFPALTGRVVDGAHMLDAATIAQLNRDLAAHEAATSEQVVVVTVPSLNGMTIEDFGYQLGRQWGIGQKDKSNGALLIVSRDDRKLRIEVGYGLEGTLTDAQSAVILNQIITPAFRQNNFSGGISHGVAAILEALRVEPRKARPAASPVSPGSFDTPDNPMSQIVNNSPLRMIIGQSPFVIFMIFILPVLLSFLRFIPSVIRHKRSGTLGSMILGGLVGWLLGGGRGGRGGGQGGGFGGGFGGGGFGGGGGGGGFRGGGGGFGGGGASGGW